MIFPYAELRQWEEVFMNVKLAAGIITPFTLAATETAILARMIKPNSG
jgi:hypothetical protein